MASASDGQGPLLRLESPVAIYLSAHVLSLNNVDTVQQVFDASLIVRGKTAGLAGTAATPENWDPRIRILNMIETRKWNRKQQVIDNGEIEFKWSIEGVFSETFELREFPRDLQYLSIIFSSNVPKYIFGEAALKSEQTAILDRMDALTSAENKSSKEQLIGVEVNSTVKTEREWLQELIGTGVLRELQSLRQSPERRSSVYATNFCMGNLFDLSNSVRVQESRTRAGESTSGTVRPVLTVSLSITRYGSYFFWNVEFPMGLLTLMAAGTFFCERSAADRLGLSLTLVLTAVAFKFVIAADLPKISYLTRLDQYVLANFCGIAVVVLENSLCETAVLADGDWDLLIVYAWTVSLVLYFTYHYLVTMWQMRCARQEHTHFEALSSGNVANAMKDHRRAASTTAVQTGGSSSTAAPQRYGQQSLDTE